MLRTVVARIDPAWHIDQVFQIIVVKVQDPGTGIFRGIYVDNMDQFIGVHGELGHNFLNRKFECVSVFRKDFSAFCRWMRTSNEEASVHRFCRNTASGKDVAVDQIRI